MTYARVSHNTSQYIEGCIYAELEARASLITRIDIRSVSRIDRSRARGDSENGAKARAAVLDQC